LYASSKLDKNDQIKFDETMKRQVKITGLTALLFSMGLTVQAQDRIIPEAELPQEIKTYISTNFPDHPVLQASLDREWFSKSYEVVLRDNIKLEFDSRNRIVDIDGNSALPDQVIPSGILAYVKSNFPNDHITDWELDDRKQKIELGSGTDLKFSMNGEFLRIDD